MDSNKESKKLSEKRFVSSEESEVSDSDDYYDYYTTTENTSASDSLVWPIRGFISEQYTSASETDSEESLGLLSEELLESAWEDDSEDLFPNFHFEKVGTDPLTIRLVPNSKQDEIQKEYPKREEIDISPIAKQTKSYQVNLPTLASTSNIQPIDHKSCARYEENILNKTVKISSVCDVSKEVYDSFRELDESNPENYTLNTTNEKQQMISPIAEQTRSYPEDLLPLESTPNIRRIDQKICTRREENILNKTVKISSVCDVPIEACSIELDEESNLENYTSNVTCSDKEVGDDKVSLNRTFQSLNILNKTLPTVVITDQNLTFEEDSKGLETKIVPSQTFVESPKDVLNKTVSYSLDHKSYELAVKAKDSKIVTCGITKKKHETNYGKLQSREKSPSWTTVDSSYTSDSISQTDISRTVTKKKISKTDDKGQGLSKYFDFSENKTDPIKICNAKNRAKPILGDTNQGPIMDSSAYDTSSSLSSGGCINLPFPPHCMKRSNVARESPLAKKAPINLGFKKVMKEPLSQKEKDDLWREEILLKNEDYLKKKYKETSKLKGYPDYKLALYCQMKEIEKVKNKRELLEIPTYRLSAEPNLPTRRNIMIPSYTGKGGSKPSCIGRPQFAAQVRRPKPLPLGAPSECKKTGRELKPLSPRIPVRTAQRFPVRVPDQSRGPPPLPLGVPGEYSRIPTGNERRYSRIPTLGHRAQTVFGPNPFNPQVPGTSTIPKKTPSVRQKPPFQ